MTPIQRTRHRQQLYQLQTLCAENYARLLKLQRVCEQNGELHINLDAAGQTYLQITRTSRYTTDMQLAHTGQHPLQGDTQLQVRLYHDARLAEAVAMHPYQRTQAHNNYPNKSMHQPDEKLQWNRFLAEWLGQLDAQGHPDNLPWREAEPQV